MSDFTIELKDIPQDFMYEKDEEILKACLKKHFEAVVFDQLVKSKVIEKEDINEDGTIDDPELRNMFQVADISFGMKNLTELSYYDKLAKLRNEFNLINDKMKDSAHQSKLKGLFEEQAKISKEFQKVFIEMQLKKAIAVKEDRIYQDPSVVFAYITFRSMEGPNAVFKAYKVGWLKRFCLMWCCCCCCPK